MCTVKAMCPARATASTPAAIGAAGFGARLRFRASCHGVCMRYRWYSEGQLGFSRRLHEMGPDANVTWHAGGTGGTQSAGGAVALRLGLLRFCPASATPWAAAHRSSVILRFIPSGTGLSSEHIVSELMPDYVAFMVPKCEMQV